jgi:uncharacterized protein (TIGR02118 family)
MAKTMAQVIAMYNVPEADRELFDKQYFETHVPLIKQVPGLRKIDVCRKPKNLMGGKSPYYLVVTLLFDDMESLKSGMSSPEGQEAGNNVMSFASNYITLLASEVEVTEGALSS